MACKEGTVLPQLFVEEIDYDEIVKLEVVGKGSFGVVWKGKWRDTFVAVKHIDSEAERKAFTVEVRQLSRVSHPNIVKLYGACTQNPVCLVMEYAEGGSLYNVLHCRPQPKYSAGHAMSWALQCAHGVAYLHSMTPKALIHRDLKPPNLLLITGGKVLKICDFGTACDKKTYMTNNKGSAAWMAPEVFEGSNYTEKCDVFSWGIILWEVLSRCKPFDDVGGPAFRIMWAVHKGERPPLIEGCPPPLEQLMTSCWHKNPSQRPAMDEVVRIMTLLFPFFEGQEEPVQYSSGESSLGSEIPDEDFSLETYDSQQEMSDYVDTSRTEVFPSDNGSCVPPRLPFAPASMLPPLAIDVDPTAWDIPPHDLIGSDGEWEPEDHPTLNGSFLPHMEFRKTAGLDKMVASGNAEEIGSSSGREDLDNVYLMLDPQLHPITPDTTCQQSVQIFEEHKMLAQEYLKVQTQIAYLSRTMDQLAERLSEAEGMSQLDQEDSERHNEELRKLENEKDSLLALHRNLKLQLELIRGHRQQHSNNGGGDDGWVVVHPPHLT